MSAMPLPPGQDPLFRLRRRYEPDALGRLGRGIWRDLPPPEEEAADSDTVVDALRGQWRGQWRGQSFPAGGFGLDLAGAVGRGAHNERADVARLETLLHRAGHYDVNGTNGPTGYFGGPQEDAVRAYQKARGLTVDGLVLPEGETMAALSSEQQHPAAEPGSDEAPPANRAPDDQVAWVAPAAGAAAVAGTAILGGAMWQQEQDRLRREGKLPTMRGTNLLDFSAPKPWRAGAGREARH